MKKQLLARLSAICIMFTLIILVSVVFNILNGYSSGWPTLLVFIWLVVFHVVDYLLSLFPFRTCRQSRLCRMAVNYLLVMAVWYWMGWVSFNVWSILNSIINYLVFYKILQTILQAQRQAKANEINRALERRRKELEDQQPPPSP